jgi:hypothetical protein
MLSKSALVKLNVHFYIKIIEMVHIELNNFTLKNLF